MKLSFYVENSRSLLFQRNVLLAFSGILLISLMVLTCLLFFKRERIVIVPPVVEKTFWVDSHTISATYLEQFGHFIAQLLLAKSDKTAPLQREVVLRHTDPRFVGLLSKKLLEEEAILREQQASYTFYAEKIDVDQKKLRVVIFGERALFSEDRKISSEKERYALQFAYSGSRLLLISIEKESA